MGDLLPRLFGQSPQPGRLIIFFKDLDAMNHLKAIGFDLFNTLITVEPQTMQEANGRLILSLKGNDFALDNERFRKAHKDAAIEHLEGCRKDGRETHNRFWISRALEAFGYDVSPEDPRIAEAVESYFSAFYDYCRIIPGTRQMLGGMKDFFRLGMLTNFTHGPAARKIITQLGLASFFDVILISGELGFRKPSPVVFQKLVEGLEVEKHQMIYIGDDPEPDIVGARNAGIQPVWFTFVRDQDIPFAAGLLLPGLYTSDERVPRITNWEELHSLLTAQPSSP
jgi:putative hydrolase of the HAD superfamily